MLDSDGYAGFGAVSWDEGMARWERCGVGHGQHGSGEPAWDGDIDGYGGCWRESVHSDGHDTDYVEHDATGGDGEWRIFGMWEFAGAVAGDIECTELDVFVESDIGIEQSEHIQSASVVGWGLYGGGDESAEWLYGECECDGDGQYGSAASDGEWWRVNVCSVECAAAGDVERQWFYVCVEWASGI